VRGTRLDAAGDDRVDADDDGHDAGGDAGLGDRGDRGRDLDHGAEPEQDAVAGVAFVVEEAHGRHVASATR
jgi:hypothetical protein